MLHDTSSASTLQTGRWGPYRRSESLRWAMPAASRTERRLATRAALDASSARCSALSARLRELQPTTVARVTEEARVRQYVGDFMVSVEAEPPEAAAAVRRAEISAVKTAQ